MIFRLIKDCYKQFYIILYSNLYTKMIIKIIIISYNGFAIAISYQTQNDLRRPMFRKPLKIFTVETRNPRELIRALLAFNHVRSEFFFNFCGLGLMRSAFMKFCRSCSGVVLVPCGPRFKTEIRTKI